MVNVDEARPQRITEEIAGVLLTTANTLTVRVEIAAAGDTLSADMAVEDLRWLERLELDFTVPPFMCEWAESPARRAGDDMNVTYAGGKEIRFEMRGAS